MGNSNTSRKRERAGVRTPRLEHLMREELNFLFEAEIGDPCLNDLQVERVQLAANAGVATIYVRPSQPKPTATETSPTTLITTELEPNVQHALHRAAAFLRRRLMEVLPMKRSPELRFRPGLPNWADTTPEETT